MALYKKIHTIIIITTKDIVIQDNDLYTVQFKFEALYKMELQ